MDLDFFSFGFSLRSQSTFGDSRNLPHPTLCLQRRRGASLHVVKTHGGLTLPRNSMASITPLLPGGADGLDEIAHFEWVFDAGG